MSSQHITTSILTSTWETACSWVGSIPPSGWDWCWSPSNSLQKKSLILWKYKHHLKSSPKMWKDHQNKWKFVLQNDISNIKMDMKTGSIAGSIAGMGHHSQHAFPSSHPIRARLRWMCLRSSFDSAARRTGPAPGCRIPRCCRPPIAADLRQICPIENGVKHQSPKTLENH